MCSSYFFEIESDEIKRIMDSVKRGKIVESAQLTFDLEGILEQESIAPVSVRPTDSAPVITKDGYKEMSFGFKNDLGGPIFNARSETVYHKTMFSRHIRERRCLVPAAFYMEKGRRFFLPDKSTMYMAGIYRETAGGVPEFVILTRDSADCTAVSSIHDRMPVILPQELHGFWFESGGGIDSALTELIRE